MLQYLPVAAHSINLPVFIVFLSSLRRLWFFWNRLLLQKFLVTVGKWDRCCCRFRTDCRQTVLEQLCRFQVND